MLVWNCQKIELSLSLSLDDDDDDDVSLKALACGFRNLSGLWGLHKLARSFVFSLCLEMMMMMMMMQAGSGVVQKLRRGVGAQQVVPPVAGFNALFSCISVTVSLSLSHEIQSRAAHYKAYLIPTLKCGRTNARPNGVMLYPSSIITSSHCDHILLSIVWDLMRGRH